MVACKFILTINGDLKNAGIYLSGNFNNWKKNDPKFRMKKNAQGKYVITSFFKKDTRLVYNFSSSRKFHKFCSDSTSRVKDFSFLVKKEKITEHTIYVCSIQSREIPGKIIFIDSSLLSPPGETIKNISVYLPPGYSTSKKRYPVIYYQGSQWNRNDGDSTGEINCILDSFYYAGKSGCIVIGLNEDPEKENGFFEDEDVSKNYPVFLTRVLKPYIDRNYRTIPGKEANIIIGKNKNAAIVMYVSLLYPEIFGKAGFFSPAFNEAQLHSAVDSLATHVRSQLFFYDNSPTDHEDFNKIIDKLGEKSNAVIYTVIDKNAILMGASLHKWFSEFYLWIMANGFNYIIRQG